MAIELDHLIVPAKDRAAGARFLAELLGVAWKPEDGNAFAPVFVNDHLTIDFAEWDVTQSHHYCFQVSDEEFDAIHGRIQAREIPYRDGPHSPMNNKVATWSGGKNLYWSCPDGHNWEILTVSYAR